MPVFIITTTADLGYSSEPFEVELDCVLDAQIEAVRFLGEMLREQPARFWVRRDASITVADEDGSVLFRLDLAATSAPAPNP
ncbi:MAG TPA: hypothetical protein VFF48_10700 [Brevundimonas sp.]|nr:hypothetical protein [Brevundimonas sp.]